MFHETEIVGTPEDMNLIMDLMGEYRSVVNKASKLQFEKKLNSIITLHNGFYYVARDEHKGFPSQMIIRAELESLASYKSNGQHIWNKRRNSKGLSLLCKKWTCI